MISRMVSQPASFRNIPSMSPSVRLRWKVHLAGQECIRMIPFGNPKRFGVGRKIIGNRVRD
jgi:hypothetical protein